MFHKGKTKACKLMTRAQTALMCDGPAMFTCKAGNMFLVLCFVCAIALLPVLAASGNVAGDVANGISTAAEGLYDAMKHIGVIVAVLGVCLAAFHLFTGGDKGMDKAKKTLLYTALGCGVLFLAVPIVNFFSGLFKDSGTGNFNDLTH